jgi:hypothetical protein
MLEMIFKFPKSLHPTISQLNNLLRLLVVFEFFEVESLEKVKDIDGMSEVDESISNITAVFEIDGKI